ncbi:MAG: thrombospondin type 3 repeat-containing protein [Gammaproteobacteria bacterium]|nr:thrombospondin type 3 repeat-containing protein [Gammaproteobacteria bacterium]
MILAPDSDGDGVADSTDNCPTVSNATQDDNGGVNSSLPDNIGDACQCGDMNADGKVTNTDAVLIQRHLLGLPSPFNESLCDVNGDSNCSNTDAVIIKRAVLALPPGVGQVCTAVVAVP